MTNREVQEAFLKAMHRFGKLNFNLCFGEELTKGEFFCLAMVRDHTRRCPDSRGMYVWDLAGHMRVRPPAVSRMLRGLEHRGLIERSVDREDRRNVYVSLTERGEQTWDGVADGLQYFTNRVIGRMGTEDMETLIGLLDRLSIIIEDEQAKESSEC